VRWLLAACELYYSGSWNWMNSLAPFASRIKVIGSRPGSLRPDPDESPCGSGRKPLLSGCDFAPSTPQAGPCLTPGLTPRAVLEKFKGIQMIDVHLPTTDGRTVILPRYTQPEQDHRMLLTSSNPLKRASAKSRPQVASLTEVRITWT
jgi:hypothetical protein